MERIPAELRGREAIAIDGLRKTFRPGLFGGGGTSTQEGGGKRGVVEAVKGVSLKIYSGEITAILGK